MRKYNHNEKSFFRACGVTVEEFEEKVTEVHKKIRNWETENHRPAPHSLAVEYFELMLDKRMLAMLFVQTNHELTKNKEDIRPEIA